MNGVDAFLWVTALTYFAALPMPKATKMTFPAEKILFAVAGALLASALAFNTWPLWIVLAAGYVAMAWMSYTRLQDWGSTAQNMLMTTWDLLVAVCCLAKI